MLGLLRAVSEALSPGYPPFAAELDQSLVLDADLGICLLTQRGCKVPRLGLGCAWVLEPRNIDVLAESECLDLARMHENLVRALPVGAAVQFLHTVLPAATLPAWEQARQGCLAHPVVRSQLALVREGVPHPELTSMGRLRTVWTLVTLRVPLAAALPDLAPAIRSLMMRPSRSGPYLAALFTRQQAEALAHLRALRQSLEETLRLSGHTVGVVQGTALGQWLARALDPLRNDVPVIQLDQPLARQVHFKELRDCSGGWAYGFHRPDGTFDEHYRAQLLTLQSAPPETYPGILCAARAPKEGDAQPLALWQAWEGPYTVAVHVAATDSKAEKDAQSWKHTLARKRGGDSIDNEVIEDQLKETLGDMTLGQNELHWGRIHVVLWGQEQEVRQGVHRVIDRGRRWHLEFALDGGALGSTLLLQTLPLGFDPSWPPEWAINRERRFSLTHLGQLMTGFGSMRGTRSPSIWYLNARGEVVYFDPFDVETNAHRVITGTSGAGKTHTVAKEVNDLMALGLAQGRGMTIAIIDPLTRYRNVCATWDGHLTSIGFAHPPCFNPFFGDLGPGHLAFINAFLGYLASGSGEVLNWSQYNCLASALAYFAAAWDPGVQGEPTLGAFATGVLETGCFTADAETQAMGRQLALRLGLFYGRGLYKAFVDGPNTFALQPGLNVIELGELENYEDLKGILFFAMVHLITEFFKDPVHFYTRKFIYFDEVWALAKLRRTAEQVDRIVRTYRNYGVSATFVSQRVEDFSSPMGEVIRDICGTTLFLHHTAKEIPRVQRLFGLSDAETQLLPRARIHPRTPTTHGWSSAFLCLEDQQGGEVRMVSDPLLLLQMSQDHAIAQRRDAAVAAAGGDRKQALLTLLEEDLAGAA
jgi:hypothetical protein